MDLGYLDYDRLYGIHQTGAFFVTRAKRGMDARRVCSPPTDRGNGVICDQTIALNGFYSSKGYPEHLRRIRFRDEKLDKTLVFLTNNTILPPLTIAALYKSRWQVELFFKWIEQHLRIKKFLGTSENCRQDRNLARRLDLRADRHHQEGAQAGGITLHNITDLVDLRLRQNPYITGLTAGINLRRYARIREPVDFVRLLTGH